jgi:xylan 1,4-beta-xylosidase
MTLARSRDLGGPYEVDPEGYLLTAKDRPDLALQRCGHGDLFDAPGGETYLTHLCSRPLPGLQCSPLGRETALQRTRWTDDGWLRLEGTRHGDGLPERKVRGPELPEHPWPAQPSRHDFDDESLPGEFQWLRSPEPGRFMSLGERPGYLRLKGKESLGSRFEQALVARRQDAFRFRAETCLEFAPENFQQSAGLVCYYNASKYHYLFVSADEAGKRHLGIMSCEADPGRTAVYPLGAGIEDPDAVSDRYRLPDRGAVWLRCEVDQQDLAFLWSSDGENWNRLPVTLNHALLADETGSGCGANFTGTFVGMCCQDLSGGNCPADFDYFEYRRLD